MAINLIVTNAGRAALINAQNNGTNAVQFAKCGISATNANYNAASTALQNELKRIDNISGSALSPDTINLAFADTSTDAYDLRAFAIYLADDTLFAIASQAAPIYSKTNNTDGLLSVNIKFSDISTSQITFANYNLVNPPSTEITAGVIEIATQTETNTGTDDLRAITPKKLTAFWNNKSAWTINNDGAGSGLDADLLDGQHGAFYLDLSNTTGTLPIARLGGTYNISISGNAVNSDKLGNILAANYWHNANDGAGSGLDADLLDGLHASAFIKNWAINEDIRIYLRVLSNQATNLAFADGLFIGYGNTNSGRTRIYGDGAAVAHVYPDFNANLIKNDGSIYWHSSNDGAGSGLDADLLDGQHGAYYWSDGRASKSLATNGYRILPDGTIEQWGEATLTGDTNQAVSFPIAFPNACLQTVGCQGGDFAVNTDAGAGVQSFTNSTITLRNGSWMTTKIRYFAIGN